MADTTQITLSFLDFSSSMEMTLLICEAHPTEVPPNFKTFIFEKL
jgi:hypothetical protein